MNLTSAQQAAVAARGNVLVVAGAGTGKTRTLVERCLACLVAGQPPASLDEILMVTFTEAAAAEMRQRIRARLEEELRADPGNSHWHEQMALFETAHLGTLHSFCLELIRQHFYELELDPQLAVLAEEEARLLADETLERLLQEHYAGRASAAEAVQQLIQSQGGGWDKPIRSLVLRLHRHSQTLPDPEGWLAGQVALFASPQPDTWRQWLLAALGDCRDRWLPLLDAQAPHNEIAAACAAALRPLEPNPSRADAAAALDQVTAAARDCPRGRKTDCLKPLKEFLGEAEFLLSLARVDEHSDPLAEDWNWVRSQMITLLEMAREFTAAFTEAKRELGMVDFHDLEQFALRLLWDPKTDKPTRIACQWRKQLRYVFVDEYQDINAAQDKIIEALSREGASGNRFLVGDVKQSIYRFRLANPFIFQGYVDTWHGPGGQVIPLVDNFRSRETLLNSINSLFGLLMRRELGGVDYDERAQLRFGAAQERRPLSAAANPAPALELHLRLKHAGDSQDDDDQTVQALAQVADLEEARKEARLVALRLRQLHAARHPVWDETTRAFRPAAWSDMAVLLRSPANKSESYAKEFARLAVPLQVARGGFYESTEISDLLSLLQLLDNPLQDLPVLAVLHSPLVGLTLDELATIRLAVKGPFWTALIRWHEAGKKCTVHTKAHGAERHPEPSGQQSPWSGATSRAIGTVKPMERSDIPSHRDGPRFAAGASEPGVGGSVPNEDSEAGSLQLDLPLGQETFGRVSRFLDLYAHWRRLARQVSLARCLEAVLAETHYAEWLLTQPRGEQRHANVQRLLGLALQFDQFQRQGLFRFLRFIEAQQLAQTEPEVATVDQENSVRLMSIHQAKGLEFPVVVLADLGKPFNVSDLRAELILDETYGLCPQIKPPHTGKRYPSLPCWLARRRQRREMLGEELRLLYVAMTRARDTLILTGSITETKYNQLWQPVDQLGPARLCSARCYADWLGWWFARNCGPAGQESTRGENALVRWQIHDDTSLLEPAGIELDAAPALAAADQQVWEKLRQRLLWIYPFLAATRKPAKTSVTALRRAARESDQEAVSLFGMQAPGFGLDESPAQARRPAAPRQARQSGPRIARGGADAARSGNAHHAFLQLVPLECAGSLPELQQAARRLQEEGLLAQEDVALLDFRTLAAFWQSDLGRKIRAQAQFVHRELAFTARFSPKEIAAITSQPFEPGLEAELIVVQGVADLAVVLPAEIWLVDFKTDALEPDAVAGRARLYAPQVKLYARALSQIYRRPVSAAWLYFLAAQTAAPVQWNG
jgi:ATP-dependent helicase/nuclease subunit A